MIPPPGYEVSEEDPNKNVFHDKPGDIALTSWRVFEPAKKDFNCNPLVKASVDFKPNIDFNTEHDEHMKIGSLHDHTYFQDSF